MEKLKREIQITKAFDKRNDDPKKDYGIGSCRLYFIVKGNKGAVTIDFFTNWFLESTVKEYSEIGIRKNRMDGTKDTVKTKINLHEGIPIHSGVFSIHNKKKTKYTTKTKCPVLGDYCYPDISCMYGNKFLPILLSKGSDGVFKELEKEYKLRFGGKQ